MALCLMPDARILVADKLLQVQRKRAPEAGSSRRCPQFEKESSRWSMNHVVLLLCCLPSTDFYLHGNSDDSVFCHSIVLFKILHRWCQFESIFSHGIKCTWQPDTSSLAGPFPSRSQDLGAKRHTATVGDGMARSFICLE